MINLLQQRSINEMVLTGTITSIDGNFKEGEELTHGLNVAVRRKDYRGLIVEDDLRVLVFWNRQLLEQLKVGDRIRFTGELQRRAYDKFPTDVTDSVEQAVLHYIRLFEERPVIATATKSKMKLRGERIDFKRIIDSGLLEAAPKDSTYDSESKRVEGSDYLTYKIGTDDKVFKVREAIAYEIIVEKPIEVIAPLKEGEVDENKATLRGRISRISQKQVNGETRLSLVVYVQSHIYGQPRLWGLPVTLVVRPYMKGIQQLKVNDYIHVKGRMHSKRQDKIERLVNHTKGGTRKLQDIADSHYIRDIYVTSLIKIMKAETM